VERISSFAEVAERVLFGKNLNLGGTKSISTEPHLQPLQLSVTQNLDGPTR
jgi:hypothetical protein